MDSKVKHIVLDSGIHHFIWLDNSREAVYEHAEKFRQVNDALSGGETVRIIMDFRETDIPPFIAIADAMKQSGLRKDVSYVSAYIADDSIIQMVINNAAMMNRNANTRKFFREDEMDTAINWLLNE